MSWSKQGATVAAEHLWGAPVTANKTNLFLGIARGWAAIELELLCALGSGAGHVGHVSKGVHHCGGAVGKLQQHHACFRANKCERE